MRRFLASLALITLTSCKEAKKDFIVGVTAGPHMEIMQDVLKRAKKNGLNIKIVEFNDFVIPNEALNSGDIHINSYQHAPFLEEQVKTRGYKIKEIGKTILLPIRLYSKKYKKLDELPEGATVAIPNDPSNRGRALLLLQDIGLITLAKKDHLTLLDIKENKKSLKIKEIEAPLLPRILIDVDAAVVNTDWMLVAKEDTKKFLAEEKTDQNPYVNILVVKEGAEKEEDLKKFLCTYYTQETVNFIKNHFKGDVLVGFKSHSHQGSCDGCCG
jgi:D-methionine transport system substrate-binding protein